MTRPLTRPLALALLVAVASAIVACGNPAPPVSATEARCDKQAYDDPAVKALLVNAGAWSSDPDWQESVARARRKSISTCLAAAGIPQRGGVESVGSGRYGLGWF